MSLNASNYDIELSNTSLYLKSKLIFTCHNSASACTLNKKVDKLNKSLCIKI